MKHNGPAALYKYESSDIELTQESPVKNELQANSWQYNEWNDGLHRVLNAPQSKNKAVNGYRKLLAVAEHISTLVLTSFAELQPSSLHLSHLNLRASHSQELSAHSRNISGQQSSANLIYSTDLEQAYFERKRKKRLFKSKRRQCLNLSKLTITNVKGDWCKTNNLESHSPSPQKYAELHHAWNISSDRRSLTADICNEEELIQNLTIF
uniref:Uncharacterized protein n=1 Tax=Glossina pallidipes TaxID=7398 RepID=A0A1B0A3L7_GLOPL